MRVYIHTVHDLYHVICFSILVMVYTHVHVYVFVHMILVLFSMSLYIWRCLFVFIPIDEPWSNCLGVEHVF